MTAARKTRKPDDATVLWHPTSHDAATAVAEAAAEYRRSGNPLVALAGAQRALQAGIPVPSVIAQWLLYGLARPPIYDRSKSPPVARGRMTMERALGLKGTGAGNVLARARREQEERASLSRMMELQSVGATIPQAAQLVARLSATFAPATLEYKYRRSGYSETAKKLRTMVRLELVHVEKTLAEYPDRPAELVKIKTAIRGMYAKLPPSRT